MTLSLSELTKQLQDGLLTPDDVLYCYMEKVKYKQLIYRGPTQAASRRKKQKTDFLLVNTVLQSGINSINYINNYLCKDHVLTEAKTCAGLKTGALIHTCKTSLGTNV